MLAERNAYIGLQCKEYQKRHKCIWGRRWWFLLKCILQNQLQDRMTGKSMHNGEIMQILGQYDIISFDIFDTLLVRPYCKPTDLFIELEERYTIPGFAMQRIAAEQRARAFYPEKEDIAFQEIYSFMEKRFQDMAQQEIALERKILQVNKSIKKIYDVAIKLGKRIIIVSDMYLPGYILENILKDKGYEGYEKIYISSETGYTKASGNMYKYVLSDLGCKAESVLHIGDNFWSDGNARRKSRLSTILISGENMIYLT